MPVISKEKFQQMKILRWHFGLFCCCISAVAVLASCDGNEPTDTNDDRFDRGQMLSKWADDIIIPAYKGMQERLSDFNSALPSTAAEVNASELTSLRQHLRKCRLQWQQVAPFMVGPAEENRFKTYMNIYPCDTAGLRQNIAEGNDDLERLSSVDQQGFPAMEYMLYGLREDSASTLKELQKPANWQYLQLLVQKALARTETQIGAWENNYRTTFVENNANGANQSVDLVVNDFVLHFEKYIRSGKIGIPAGVFSGEPLPGHVEAPYARKQAKAYLVQAIAHCKRFYNGNPANAPTFESLAAYTDFLNVEKEGALLSKGINDQFAKIETSIAKLPDDLYATVENDRSLLLSAFDEMQQLVVLLKVDMMQALNISVDYVDADGD